MKEGAEVGAPAEDAVDNENKVKDEQPAEQNADKEGKDLKGLFAKNLLNMATDQVKKEEAKANA